MSASKLIDQTQRRWMNEDLSRAHFADLDLSGAIFEGVILSHATFERVDLSHVTFLGANLQGATFTFCNLNQCRFVYAHLEDTRFESCDLTEIQLLGTVPTQLITQNHQTGESHGAQGTGRVATERLIYARSYLYKTYHWPSLVGQRETLTSKVHPPLILLHGMTGHALDFESLINQIEREVYAINLMGHGQGPITPLRELFQTEIEGDESLEDPLCSASLSEHGLKPNRGLKCTSKELSFTEVIEQIKHVIKELLEADGHDRFELWGYSMGGRVALHIASDWQDNDELLLEKLILISASPGIKTEAERDQRREADRKWSEPLWAGREVDDFLTEWNAQSLLVRLQNRNPIEASRLLTHREQHRPEGLALAFDVLGQGVMPPLHHSLASIKYPILWVAGEEDLKYSEIALECSKDCSHGELLIIEGCGHAPHLEDLRHFLLQLRTKRFTHL